MNSYIKFALSAVTVAILAACSSSSSSGSGSGTGTAPSPSVPIYQDDLWKAMPGDTDEEKKQNLKEAAAAKAGNDTGVIDDLYDAEDDEVITINGPDGKEISSLDFNKLKFGLTKFDMKFEKVDPTTNKVVESFDETLLAYNRAYSFIAAEVGHNAKINDQTYQNINMQEAIGYTGLHTTNFEDLGKANYEGIALVADETGKFNYTMDFDTKVGSGSIRDFDGIMKNITLEESYGFTDHVYGRARVDGQATATGYYGFAFFGPKAEEIAGVVKSDVSLYDDYGDNFTGGSLDAAKKAVQDTGFVKGDIIVSGTKQ